MIIENFKFTELHTKEVDGKKKLVLCAFNRLLSTTDIYPALREKYPNAEIISFSTSGHFISAEIEDETPVISAIEFENSSIHAKSFHQTDFESSYHLGKVIGTEVKSDSKGILVISDGGLINGTDLITGINEGVQVDIPIFGGMAGDSTRFEQTLVGLNEPGTSGKVVIVSFHGDHLHISSNHDDAWKSLGLEFTITKSSKNKLFELNNQNAYEVLYDFLGSSNKEDFTKDTLYYPFQIFNEIEAGVIRTPIGVDHDKKVLTYAGNMPEGSKVKLMKSGTMELLDSTLGVAQRSKIQTPELVLAISCVGRRVVLDDMANEEFTELNSVFGGQANYFGFYSYGEFSRTGIKDNCALHNQTLTLATLSEK